MACVEIEKSLLSPQLDLTSGNRQLLIGQLDVKDVVPLGTHLGAPTSRASFNPMAVIADGT